MGYQVKYEKRAIKMLQKIDHSQQKMLIQWIEKNLVNTDNPRLNGKKLKGNLNHYWRYRVDKYRIIAKIMIIQLKF